MLPHSSPQKSTSQAVVPMWDSSDPRRNPAPLPLNPKPGSPRTLPPLNFESPNSSREVSPVRRGREDSITAAPVHASPTRASQIASGHKRSNSSLPSPSVREMQHMILNGGNTHTSSNRNVTPTPKELFGSSTTFPIREKDVFTKEYSSSSYRKSLDFDKTPTLPPLRSVKTLETPPQNTALTTTRPIELDDTPPKMSVHEFSTLTSQLSGITSIATNLQREMANLSRRSKDNATDLIALKEATRNRDEDIRRSLRDLAHNLGPIEGPKLLQQAESALPSLPLITAGSSSSSDSSGDSSCGGEVSIFQAKASDLLEQVMKDMPTKLDQERVIHILNDIKQSLKDGVGKSESDEQIRLLLEEIRDREDARGKELVISGAQREHNDAFDEKVVSILEDLREEVQEKDGEQRILSILEEIREKETSDKGEERILEALEELKESKDRDGDDRLDEIIALLHAIRDKDGDEKVVQLLSEVKESLATLAGDFEKHAVSIVMAAKSQPSEELPEPKLPEPQLPDDILSILNDLAQNINSTGEVGKETRTMLEEWKSQWGGHGTDFGEALKDLSKEIEVLATEQRTAISRMASGMPHSQALTTTHPPIPPDLDNEAAITALANIASTTTRTDITLSSINALIKVFQKDSQATNNNNAETLNSMGRFLEEVNGSINKTSSQLSDFRKVIEVVRTGVCSGNDRQAAFEGTSLSKLEALTFLQQRLNDFILGSEDQEAMWTKDAGVKDEVVELSRKLEELIQSSIDNTNQSSEKIVEAINETNPADLIAELKVELGAMAERSLQVLRQTDSRDALQQLREAVDAAADRSMETVKNADSSDAIAEFRAEMKEMIEKAISLSETIESKDSSEEMKNHLSVMKEELTKLVEKASSDELSLLQNSLENLKDDFSKIIEESLTTAVAAASADEKTAAALSDLKVEVSNTLSKAVTLSEKPDESEKILEPIAELRKEIHELVEKSNSALAAPVNYPEADEIKARIEILAKGFTEAMDRASSMAAESSADADAKIKITVDELRQNIGDMGSSIAAAVSSNSATAVEESLKGTLDEIKTDVLGKLEESLVAFDKVVSSNSETADTIKEAIDKLNKDVIEMVDKNVSMAISTVKSEEPEPSFSETLNELKTDISAMIESSLAAHAGSNEVKEVIEGLQKEIADMVEKSTSMIVQASDPPDTMKALLEGMKFDLSEIIQNSSSASEDAGAEKIKDAIEALRAEVHEMVEKSMMMIAPRSDNEIQSSAAPSSDEMGQLLEDLKKDMNEMVEKSLAAAIANSTFDSEENVKEAIDELKREVKDTVEKSMVPAPQTRDDTPVIIRESLDILRQEFMAMLEKKATGEAEDWEDVRGRLDGLKGQFGEMLEKSSNVEVKEAVETLTSQVEVINERLGAAETLESLEALKSQIDGLDGKIGNDEVKSAIDDLKLSIEEMLQKSMDPELQITVGALKEQVSGLITANADAEFKISLDEINEKIDKLADSSTLVELKVTVESLKTDIDQLLQKPADGGFKEDLQGIAAKVEELGIKSSDEELRASIENLKAELQLTMEGPMSTLDSLKTEDIAGIRTQIEAFRGEVLEAMAKNMEAFKGLSTTEALEQFKVDLKDFTDKALVVSSPSTENAGPNAEQFAKLMALMEDLRKDINSLTDNSKGAVVRVGSDSESVGPEGSEVVEIKDAVADANSAIGECRVEVAVVKASVEEGNAEVKEEIAGVSKTLSESQEQSTSALSGVKDVIEVFQAETKEGVSGISVLISEFEKETKESVATLKEVVDGIKEDSKEGFEEVNKTVESAQVDLKEVITSMDSSLEARHTEIKEAVAGFDVAVKESRAEAVESFSKLNTAVETSANEFKEDIATVKKVLEESQTAELAEHSKTQKQVDEIFGLVDGLQSEWKGNQPTLFNALLEMKHLLLEAQKASQKPELEAIMPPPPPPAYDDSQMQEKLDQLIAGNSTTAKYMPQLDLLDSIQQQVSATSADISQFLEIQKSLLQDDAAAKIEAARQAEINLEKATSEKAIIEAATISLRDEHEKLQESVDLLRDETEDLNSRKVQLRGEVSSLETALNLRREELLMLEARGEALERRMLEGVIEQSRVLLMKPKTNPTRLSKADTNAALRKINTAPSHLKPKVNAAGQSTNTGRRHLSLNQINNDLSGTKSGRVSLSGGGTLGLGQKEYSASLGLLSRSQSVKHTSYTSSRRKSSLGYTRIGKENEHEPIVQEEEVDEFDPPTEDVIDIVDEDGELGSDNEGSVVRNAEDDEAGDLVGSMQRRSKNYPALGLDFSVSSESLEQRSVSGVSSVA